MFFIPIAKLVLISINKDKELEINFFNETFALIEFIQVAN